MPFGPLPEGVNLYIINTILIAAYLIVAIVGMEAKKNYLVGVRTPTTFSSEEIWSKANKRAYLVMLAFTIPLLILNFIFAFLKLGEPFGEAILIIFAIGIIAINTYNLKYAENLAKEKGIETSKVKFPAYAIITLILITIALAIIWYLIFK